MNMAVTLPVPVGVPSGLNCTETGAGAKPAHSSAALAARLWAEKMKPVLGTVVIENKGGGGGVIGAAEVARAQPDGHTFVFGNTSTQVLIPAIMEHPPYDAVKDFAGIYIVCLSPTC